MEIRQNIDYHIELLRHYYSVPYKLVHETVEVRYTFATVEIFHKNTTKTPIKTNDVKTDSIVFYDAIVILGSQKANQTEKPVRVVGYQIGNVKYWVATDRFELTAEQIAAIYKLRWEIEKFFAWWKHHLKVYHIIARTRSSAPISLVLPSPPFTVFGSS